MAHASDARVIGARASIAPAEQGPDIQMPDGPPAWCVGVSHDDDVKGS
jgi:hypothetical protein